MSFFRPRREKAGMQSCARVKEGTRVVPLTPELATLLHADAQRALRGDGTCTLDNMTVSCFAAEHCMQGNHAGEGILRSLLHDGYSFVCIDDTHTPPKFVGCAKASLCPQYIAHKFPCHQRPDGLVLFSLCVDERYRRQRVGARLIERVLEVGRRTRLPVFLLVARGCGATGECMLAFQARVLRLRETYTHLGWQEQCECDEYILFKHPG